MVRRRDAAWVIELTWSSGGIHLWAREAGRGNTAALGELMQLVDDQLHRSLAFLSAPSRIPIRWPDPVGMVATATLRVQLGSLPDLNVDRPSASLAWFNELARGAGAAIDAGHLRPTLSAAGAQHLARWEPTIDAELHDWLASMRSAMPEVCAVPDVGAAFASIVDAMARRRLNDEGWRPKPPLLARGQEFRTAQATFRALGSASGAVLYRADDVAALVTLQRRFADEFDRASGAAVLAGQVRLHVPEDADGAWEVTLELVDSDDPQRWCSANDIVERTPLAADLAGAPSGGAAGDGDAARQIDRLLERVTQIGRALAGRVEHLGALADDPSGAVALDIADVDPFLEQIGDVAEELDVRLVGPEQLLRARTGVRADASPSPSSASHGRLNAIALVDWRATVDDAPVDDAVIERAIAAGSSLIHVGGRWVRIDPQRLRATMARVHAHRETRARIGVGELLTLASQLGSTASMASEQSVEIEASGWIEQLMNGLGDERLTELHEPDGFVGELRHYQRRALSWMGFLGRLGLGGCLADDMGLGKTATTLAHLASRPGPHLVVCPLSVVHNWQAEAARFTPDLQVAIRHGADRSRIATGSEMLPVDIVVTTYGLLARDVHILAETPWATVVLDEAQAIKNHLSRAAHAVRALRADQKLALTGTPVENHLGDLWSLLDAVNPNVYGTATQFAERYAKPIQRNQDPAAIASLRRLTQPFVLRRTKADKTLLPELPDKIEQIAWATMTREQVAMYQAVVDQLLDDASTTEGIRRRGLVLAALTRLKQICNHPAHASADGSRLAGRSGKLNRFDELVDDLLDVGERALVFTQFREMGLLLQRHLRERFAAHPRPEFDGDASFLHGGVSRPARQAMIDRFQSADGPPLLLVSLRAGGAGLNLTAASQVIHYDRWWNPAVEDQATDRAWRMGQRNTVLVHKMVCEGTLEERISQLIDDKRSLASSVLATSGEQWLTELSTDDLRSLVSLDGPRSTQGSTR